MALPLRARVNWIICIAFVAGAYAVCVRVLMSATPKDPEFYHRDVSVNTLAFHALIALSFVGVLIFTYFDTNPFVIQYKVMGQPAYPEVEHKFIHHTRWCTFTLWCNTLCALYFCLALVHDSWELTGSACPQMLKAMLALTWEVVFPMSFLVNVVVSFVLLPAIKAAGDFEKLDYMLRWKPLVLHNGFVLFTSIEAALVSPHVVAQDLPMILLFGLTYTVFAWFLWLRTGIYFYFFLDPRFDHAFAGLLALLALCSGLHYIGALADESLRSSLVAKALLIASAVSTCRWPKYESDQLVASVGSVSLLLRACGCDKTAKSD